ncbi:MAG TPA: hypothetical protein VKV73_16625 [Chloroflexota bacterium]|nr:hypothetical protein [Chloroflexota bacterium]
MAFRIGDWTDQLAETLILDLGQRSDSLGLAVSNDCRGEQGV